MKPTGAISETGFMKSMFSCLPSFATEADTEKEERKRCTANRACRLHQCREIDMV
ncbi:hypothetical protein PO124_14565 [Bacillus licheniformis]|nr:hypothetical protein [Bacillus licheniformis]